MDAEFGAEVGSTLMVEQLISEVGVLKIMGFPIARVEVGAISASTVHALRIKALEMDNININKIRFMISLFFVERRLQSAFYSKKRTEACIPSIWLIYWLSASCSCSKLVIHAMVLTKSARDLLCSRRARTAGPTGSSPAAPPGKSA